MRSSLVHVAPSQANVLQAMKGLGLGDEAIVVVPNLSDDPLCWWKELVGICPGGMYSNKHFPYTYIHPTFAFS